jgi:hypothetical protein
MQTLPIACRFRSPRERVGIDARATEAASEQKPPQFRGCGGLSRSLVPIDRVEMDQPAGGGA